MMKTRYALAFAAAALLSPLVQADWQIGPGSQVQFVSIKNNAIGEVSHFETLAGTVITLVRSRYGWRWTRLKPTSASATSG